MGTIRGIKSSFRMKSRWLSNSVASRGFKLVALYEKKKKKTKMTCAHDG